MKRTPFITAVLVAGATLAAIPSTAFADDQHDRDRRGGQHARSDGNRGDNRGGHNVGRAVPRSEGRPVVVAPRGGRPVVVAPRVTRPVVVAPRVVRPTVVAPYYPHSYYVRPYYARPYYVRPYAFRPRFSIGVGIVVGYPVPYAYSYPYPVPVYGYSAPSAPVVVGPNSSQYGGLSLEMSPLDAAVYVDGSYAGRVEDFDGSRETLTLAAGRHRIEIESPGYEPMAFDVDVAPGQIIPYQGSLQPVR